MSNEWFFEKFALIADAPGAVERMRKLILTLAMQGKLVPQCPDDEPAAVLVAKLKGTEITKNGRLRKVTSLPELTIDELPFDLPPGWVWQRLGCVGETNIGLTYSPNDLAETGVPVLRSSNIQDGKLDFGDIVRVKYEPKKSVMVQNGDLLICARNGSKALVGKVAVIENLTEPAAFGAFMAIFRSRINQYLYYFISSPLFRRMIDEVNTTTINQITQNNLRTTLAPIPPLAEQKRIVAKVDELMGLCDELEAQQQERELRKSVLVRSSLSRFAESPTRENLGYLFHNSYDIPPSELRKSILTLAVQGKLVPQDPNDEPAAISKDRHIKESFSIPEKWTWIHLEELQPEFQNGASSRGDKDGIPVIVIRLADIDKRRICLENPRSITILKDQIVKYRLEVGDTLITRVNGSADIVGTFIPVLESFDVIYCDHFIRMRIDPDRLFPGYTALVGDSQLVREQIRNLFITTAGQKTVNQGHLRSLAIPLPPLAEQRRIVAKVDQLMALVDELERQQAASREKASNLLDAIVHEMTSGG